MLLTGRQMWLNEDRSPIYTGLVWHGCP